MNSEALYHLGVKALLQNSQGQFLLLRTNPQTVGGKDYWDLPGGRVQDDDSVTDTLRREIAEETGISNFLVLSHLGMILSNIKIPLANRERVGLILSIYACRILDTSQQVRLSNEHTSFDWVAPAKAAELLATKYTQDFCRLVSELKNAKFPE